VSLLLWTYSARIRNLLLTADQLFTARGSRLPARLSGSTPDPQAGPAGGLLPVRAAVGRSGQPLPLPGEQDAAALKNHFDELPSVP
jgi:hypothetical protein